MAAMVAAAAMADEPAVDLSIAEVSGNAKLTWGVDLDEGDTGFKNDTEAKLKVNFVNGGSTLSEGEGIWGEVEVKVGDALIAENGEIKGGKAAIETAKLHIGDLYIGLKEGDIQVGEVKLPNAVFAEDKTRVGLDNVGSKDETQGLVVGYGTDDFGLAVDFRSVKDKAKGSGAGTNIIYYIDKTAPGTIQATDDDGWKTLKEADTAGNLIIFKEIPLTAASEGSADYYTNHYGVSGELELKDSNSFVPGLFAKAGVSYAFGSEHQFDEVKNLGFGVSAGYKVPVGEDFYLKPTVALTGAKPGDLDMVMNLGASVIFGFGGDQKDNAGVYYLDADDVAKKVTPGVGVAFLMPDLTGDGTKQFEIVPSFYSGDIVPGLKAAVLGDIVIYSGDAAPDPKFGVAAGLSYELAVGDAIKVTPKAGFRFANVNGGTSLPAISKKNTDNGGYTDVAAADGEAGLLNVKAGVDISGLIKNTTFGAYYQSRNLKALKDAGKAGTFNVFVKVSI